MEIFVFDFDTGNDVIRKFLRTMHEFDVPHQYLECLCNYQNYIEHAPEVSIVHPSHDPLGCNKKVKDAIERNPNSKFYIVARQSDDRGEIIGDHPNAKYILGRSDTVAELRDVLMGFV